MGRRPLLTKGKVLAVLQQWTARYGRAPSLAELRKELGVGSTRTVFRYLQLLHKDGAVEHRPGAVGVKLLRPKSAGLQTRAVPIVGQVPAGAPMLAEENVEGWIRMPMELVGPPLEEFFLLHVRGTSMNDAAINGGTIEDGDLVLVRQQTTAKTRDIVVALIDGEATVKKLVVATGYHILQPVSTVRTHRPIVVESDFRVLGKVVRVLKKGSRLLREVFEDESEGS